MGYGFPVHVDETLWERLETEFTLPALEQVHARLASLHTDPGPGIRPVDALNRHPRLAVELDAFARRIAPRPLSR